MNIVNPMPLSDMRIIRAFRKLEFKGLEKIGEGCSGIVYKYKNYAIKYSIDSEYIRDGDILKDLQDIHIFPKLYFYTNEFMVTEYIKIKDKLTYDYFEKNVFINLDAYDIYYLCYKRGYIPFDIHDENVIVTEDERLKIIDVGSFIKVNYNKDLDEYIEENKRDFTELKNIINHVKRPSIAI